MKKIKLSDICEVIAGQSPPSTTYNNRSIGLPFYQGKADFGDEYPHTKIWCDSPLRIAKKNDILISVRAPVGPTNICTEESCIGRGLSAIRVYKGIHYKYLFYYLRRIENRWHNKTRGSTFDSITQDDIKSIDIPIPSKYEEQIKIVNVLDKSDAIRKKRREAIRLADEFLRSTFLEMFGDPIFNKKKWRTEKFEDVGELARGKSKHRPRNAPFLLGGKYPLIQTGDIANSGGYIKEYQQTYSEEGLKQSRIWPKGTLCITIAANIAKTGILTFDACFPDSVVGFKPYNKVRTEFVQFWMGFLQKILEEKAPESAQKNINLEILRNLDILVPPIKFQNKFAEIVEKTEKLKQKYEQSLLEAENLFNSLMQRAFRGEV